MIVALGVARAAPGRRTEMLEACRRVAQASRQDEGCVEYGFHTDIDDPDLVTSVEIWRSQADLDSHMEHDHTRQFLHAVADLTDGSPQMQLLDATPAP